MHSLILRHHNKLNTHFTLKNNSVLMFLWHIKFILMLHRWHSLTAVVDVYLCICVDNISQQAAGLVPVGDTVIQSVYSRQTMLLKQFCHVEEGYIRGCFIMKILCFSGTNGGTNKKWINNWYWLRIRSVLIFLLKGSNWQRQSVFTEKVSHFPAGCQVSKRTLK